jgi:hypothetical protein
MRRNEISPAGAGACLDGRKPSGNLELARRVAASCGGTQTEDLAAALDACATDPACYEASVRGSAGGALRTGRMMIERASGHVVEAIAQALDVALPAATSRWLDLAQGENVPVIAGWDLRGGGKQRCVKLYVNASDASRSVRARLSAALIPGVADTDEPAAVLGMNARADGRTETKLYVQSADPRSLAGSAGARAAVLAATTCDEGADAGAVLSFDIDGGTLRARAFFVALREPQDEKNWRCVRSLPGYDPRAIEALLPFPPAAPRSVGISLGDDSWTAYFKPRNSSRAPDRLEPVAIFRLDGAEVGVFVEPTENAVRAFRRTERHAVSIRLRHGTAEPRALESLVDWFTDQLRTAEREGAGVATRLDNPPAPWRIGETAPLTSAGERS